MQLSTVKRESLIPPAYLVSIALLLTVAFIVLIPSRETFSFASNAQTTDTKNAIDLDDLDLAYLKARDASGDLSSGEMRNIIHTMIRSKRWQLAQQLLADRPEIQLDSKDAFLLRLETATAGYVGAGNNARTASYEASLTSLLTQLIDTPSLHDQGTLLRAAQISRELRQPELSASYNLLLATSDPDNAVKYLEQCARVLAHYDMHGQAASCYRTAIAKADHNKKFSLKRNLVSLLAASGDQFAANAELEDLVRSAPQQPQQLSHLAELALASERPDLAYPLYAKLSTIDDDRAVFWLEKAATWAQASNLPGLAAEYVLTITELSDAKYTSTLAKRRQHLLLAAGRNDEALQTLHERLRAQPESGELLIEGVKLASSMGLTSQAMAWNEDYLAIRPFDIDAMLRQVDFSLAQKQLDSALQWGQTLVDVDPLNKDHRLKLAQLEEWNGNVQAAQEQRMWLANNHPTIANDQELIRLAELNWDAATAANALRRIARREQLSTENLIKLVKLYEQDGRPDLAARALEDMMTGSPRDAMMLRELAALHRRHDEYRKSLEAWQKFAARFGTSSEESINQMELNWRLKQESQAVVAAGKIYPQYLANATEYQLKLLTELGWRHRKPEFVIAAAPHMERLDLDDYERVIADRRMVQSFIDKGDTKAAVEFAEDAWRKTGELEFLLSSMHIALEEDIYPHKERYLDANGDLIELREIPDYWVTVADYYNRNSNMQAALETYQNTLEIQPDNADALSGIIWTLLGNDADQQTLTAALDKYQDAATNLPELWSPYAVGYMKAKNPQASLRWFSKIMAKDDHDYNILLSFADALEQTGNVNHAYKVRSYALSKLRPLVLAETGDKTDSLARDYIGLLRSYGSAGENEVWTRRLLADLPNASEEETAWRREMAASWYLTTQRNDYARLIMTKIHEKRLTTPVWQQLALALHDDDIGTIQEILASGKELSSNDRILALRKIGKERQAWALATDTMENSSSETDRVTAREHVMALRGSRPGYYAAAVRQHEIGKLNITESGLSLRHTLAAADIGFAVDYKRSLLASNQLTPNSDIEDDVAVSAYFGNSRRGGKLTAGMNSQGNSELQYSSGTAFIRDLHGRKELSTEVTFNEVAEGTAENHLAAKQDRAELAYQHTLGKSEFIKLSGNMNEITTRDTDQEISKGFGGSIELGTTGSFGSNSWTMGLVATGTSNDSFGSLPVNAAGMPVYSRSSIIRTDVAQQLALSAALFRGGINSDYPQAASPRYHMRARVGQNWPAETVALELNAGAGFRLLGNDELSFEVAHDRSVDLQRLEFSNSTIGIHYRNHF